MEMPNTIGKLIIKDLNIAIYKTEKSIMGGNYSVIDFDKKEAKSALCLNAAYELFKKLKLKKTLILNNMISDND